MRRKKGAWLKLAKNPAKALKSNQTSRANHLKSKTSVHTRFKRGAWMRPDDLKDEYPRV